MFNTEGFWKSMIIFILILAVIIFAVNQLILKKLKNRSKIHNILINIAIALSVAYLFYLISGIFPDIIDPNAFMLQSVINSILNICVLALATTGIVLIFKTSTTTNFAQGMIATFGAYTAAKLIAYLGLKFTGMGPVLLIILTIIGGALTAFALGVLVDVLIIRKSKVQSPIGKQMITMGLVLVLSGGMPLLFGSLPLPIPRLTYADNIDFTLFSYNLNITAHALYALIITIGLLIILFSALRFTKWGLGVRATASSEIVANMMGVNTRIITAMSWGIAGLLGSVAAILYTPVITNVDLSMMIPTQVNGFMAAVLGSFSSFAGPLLATVFMPIINSFLNYVVGLWNNAVLYIIILVIILVKPMGLFGKKIAKKV